MKTYMAKSEDITKKWYVVDAEGMVLGRLASQVASILRGKNKPTFTPHVDCGDYVIILNTDKVVLTGNKLEQKEYIYHTGHIGNLKRTSYKKMMEEKSDVVVYEAIKGMLPKNSLGRKMLKKARIYKGSEHTQEAQTPEVLKLV